MDGDNAVLSISRAGDPDLRLARLVDEIAAGPSSVRSERVRATRILRVQLRFVRQLVADSSGHMPEVKLRRVWVRRTGGRILAWLLTELSHVLVDTELVCPPALRAVKAAFAVEPRDGSRRVAGIRHGRRRRLKLWDGTQGGHVDADMVEAGARLKDVGDVWQ